MRFSSTLVRSTLACGLILYGRPAHAAPFAYIANYSSDTVTVLDVATNKTVATIPTQSHPVGVAIRQDGSRVYVTNGSSASVTVIDANTNSVLTHIGVGVGPEGIALKPDGTRAYVANYYGNSVTVINTATNTVLNTIPDISCPDGIAVNPAGTRVYVTRACTTLVTVIDTATNTILGAPIPVGSGPLGVAFNPTGTRAYVVNQDSDNVSVIDTAIPAVITTVVVGDFPYGVLVNPLSTHVYVTNRYSDTVSVIETATHTVVGTIPTGDYPLGIDIHPAGTRLYIANADSDNVSVLNPSNNSLITHLPVGDNPISLGKFIGPAPAPQSTRRLSLGTGGRQGLGDALQAAVSSNGRYVAFTSDAANLVGGDTNGVSDIFVRDRLTGATTRVSRGPGGVQANGASSSPAIADDGRYVAFASEASNLVVGDTNEASDIFVYDRVTTVTTRMSVATGAPGAQGNGASVQPSISQDGRYVAFASEATTLVAGDTNGVYDVFVRDRVANTTRRVSVNTAGVQAVGGDSLQPFIADNGLFVAFISAATNLVASDTNGKFDVFVRSLAASTTVRASVSSAGAQANGDSWQPSLNNTGTFIVFASDATNLVTGDSNGVTDIFLRTGATTTRESLSTTRHQSDSPSYQPVVSNDGRYVVGTKKFRP